MKKILTALFLAGLFIVCGAGISSAQVYTVKQLEDMAIKDPNEINKLKDKVITIKDFEFKLGERAEKSLALYSVDLENAPQIYRSGGRLVLIVINTTDKQIMNTKVGDKITVKVKLMKPVREINRGIPLTGVEFATLEIPEVDYSNF